MRKDAALVPERPPHVQAGAFFGREGYREVTGSPPLC